MNRLLVRLTAALGLVASAAITSAMELPQLGFPMSSLLPRGNNCAKPFSCDKVVEGLSKADCQYISSIGIHGQGTNARQGPAKGIWVGKQGPNKFVFENKSKGRITVIIWNSPKGDFQSSFMNVRAPQVTWSLAKGQKVTVSLAMGISGGFAALYEKSTTLSDICQMHQTWGEFTSGQSATINVSREPRMDGDPIHIKTPIGCVANMEKCAFVCKNGLNKCGEPGSYELKNCVAPNDPNKANREQPGATPQKGASFGLLNGQPEGGCQGWEKGGNVEITFLPK